MYKRCVTRMSRSAIIIAVDSSISMQEWTTLYNTRMRKMEAAALIANFAIDEIVMRSTRYGNMRDYYDIAVLQYSGDGIEPIITHDDSPMVHINTLSAVMPQPVCYNIVHEEEDGTHTTMPMILHEWVKAKAYGTAPMYETFVYIKDLLSKWCDDSFNRRSFPPIVINISDGCCSDAEDTELLDIAKEIEQIGTKDGSTLIVNIYLANEQDDSECTLFPSVCDHFSHDHDCQMLYDMSSTLPQELEYIIDAMVGRNNTRQYKCFARNAALCEILNITDIGTEGGNKYR